MTKIAIGDTVSFLLTTPNKSNREGLRGRSKTVTGTVVEMAKAAGSTWLGVQLEDNRMKTVNLLEIVTINKVKV